MLGFLADIAAGILSTTISSHVDDLKNTALVAANDAVKDVVYSVITGRQTIDEWADIAIKGVDKIKEKAKTEENLHFVDGKLRFAYSTKNAKKIVVSFELYFIDDNKEWKKTEASCDMYASNFTEDALEEIKQKGKVEFEVED